LNETKFGVFLPFYSFQNVSGRYFDVLRNVVLECEKCGYHSVWLDDHLMYENSSILECWTTLSALSSITNRIRLGTMASCNSFRNPALLAKMASTVDVISNGRLELAIGAGAQESEHIAYGIPFPCPKDRVDRLDEAVEVIKKMWTEEKASYSGKYYQIKEAVCEPKPRQKPYPPITIAGGGEKLMLKVTAKHADRYDWGYLPSSAVFKHKLAVLQDFCQAINRDFQEIEKSCWPAGQIFIHKEEFERKPANVLPETETASFTGTPQELMGLIKQYRELGVTFFTLFFGDLPKMDSLRLFAEAFNKKTL
jgi:alkanesulfonate monooxygenase SsuD/methylene tetrahydromethanopterin reductase-like flavin-dependent oxidoreductase (luciferase family)